MNSSAETNLISASSYDRSLCQVGVVHLGFGAFHRAHQAFYLDQYMDNTGDLRWGIGAVNLRSADAEHFKAAADDNAEHQGYFLKSYSGTGESKLQRVRSHVQFADWSTDKLGSEALLSLPTVHLVSITVTESGYYTDPDGNLNLNDPTIKAEIAGEQAVSVYGFLCEALTKRVATTNAPLTIACCDNIRQNGEMLRNNMLCYLKACNQNDLAQWIENHVAFPCSMVDRITPRSPAKLAEELSSLLGKPVTSPVMAEDFIQWVLQSEASAPMPELAKAGVTVTPDVHVYEETKIRVLNGGHTALAYLAALEGVGTFDAAMRVPHLLEHFEHFERQEALPALTLDLPFSKTDYLQAIIERFGNAAIGDTVARICADGMAKFPIFIRPTLEGCLQQGIVPTFAIRSIASWHTFARHVDAGKVGFDYVEPSWSELQPMLGTEHFILNRQLWGELPTTYPEFADTLQQEINDMESKLTLRGVRKSYGDVEVMHGVDLDIVDGEFVVFVGPSGCGKSTLLRMIAGLEEISDGTVAIGDKVVNDVAASKRGVSMVFQTYALYPHMTVYKNMAFGLKQIKTAPAEIDKRVKAAADILQITDYLDRSPRNLSGGQRQRVAIGRAIVRDPEVFLFDEPLSNLDAALRVQTRLEIARLHERLETTMIYVTHDQVEAMTLADKIVVLRDGRIEQIGSPIELYDHPENAFVAQFIGSPKMNFFTATDLATSGNTLFGRELSGDVQVGIRPEHLVISDAANAVVEGTLELVENLGEYALVHLLTPTNIEFIAKTERPPEVAKGSTISFDIKSELVHFFDAKSGNRLA